MAKRSLSTGTVHVPRSTRRLFRALLCALVVAPMFHATVAGQLAAPNTPVLPPLPKDLNDPEANLKTDLLAQRQLEAEIVVSTRNSQHLITFFNDYRSVDIENDTGIGGVGSRGLFGSNGLIGRVWAWLSGKPVPRTRTAAAEATTGFAASSDGGLTWTGGLTPGSFDDNSPAGAASPAHGLEAMTDPRAVAAPCGFAYMLNVAFTRGGQSKVLLSKFQDINANDGGQTWRYLGQSVVESAFSPIFLDLPYIAIDVPRWPTADPCDHIVYVAWARFSSQTQSRIRFAKSLDGGHSWFKTDVSGSTQTNQGVVIAVDPRPGLPFLLGGGMVYVGWRVFGPTNPDAMMIAHSIDFGHHFSSPRNVNTTALRPYDQPSLGSDSVGPAHLAFRSNAFMSLAIVPHPTDWWRSNIFAAWQERVDVRACGQPLPMGASCGKPVAGGDPRIVVTRSDSFGFLWRDPAGQAGRKAVDLGDRDNPNSPDLPKPGFGYLPLFRSSGPQMMPRLAASGGRLVLGYLEGRGPLTVVPAPGSPAFATGLYRQTDARLAILNSATGALVGTNQVSRYPVRVGARLSDGETVDDLVELRPGVPVLSNKGNAPSSGSGRIPFFGDYVGVTPITTFVHDQSTRRWRHATQPGDLPFRGFHFVFPDSRHVVPPDAPTEDQQVALWPQYAPPGLNVPSCVNPGARNHDVVHSLVDVTLPVNSIAGFKRLGVIARNFPVTFNNVEGTTRFFRASLTPAAISSFDQFDPNIEQVDLEILPYSSITKPVTVESADPVASVVVDVAELAVTCSSGPITLDNPACTAAIDPAGQRGSVTLNLDPTNGEAAAPSDTETHNPIVTNPIVTNPIVTNPIVTNDAAANPIVTNPIVTNPIVTNDALADKTVFGITDVTWTVTNAGTDATSYLSQVALSNFAHVRNNYVFHLFIYKVASAAGVNGCQTMPLSQDQILSSIPNPIVTNPIVTNPIVTNPIVTNPIVTNSTFAAAPSDAGATAAMRTADFRPRVYAPDGTTQEIVTDAVNVTLRGYQIVPNDQLTPDTTFNPTATPPTIVVTSATNNTVNGVVEDDPPVDASNAPDLLIQSYVPAPGGRTAAVGESETLSGFSLRNQGDGGANSGTGTFRTGVYLSTDALIDPTQDLFLGGVTNTNADLPAGAAFAHDGITVTIPSVAPGNYFIGVYTNDEQLVVESALQNNAVSEPIAIEAGTPLTGLRFVTEPRPVTTNQPALPAIEVEARDNTGAALPGVAVTLGFGANPGDANLMGGSATTNALGIASFHDLRVDRSASGYTLLASASGFPNATSASFNTFGLAPTTCTPTPFTTAPVRAMGTIAVSVVAADFNNDGFIDLATANEGPGTVSVRRGAGDGTFDATPQTFPTFGTSPQQLVAADFNRDGWVDMATTNSSSGDVSVFINNTDGGFLEAVTYETATEDPSPGLAVGDVNGDGRLDLVVLTVSDSSGSATAINVFRGDGVGGFADATEHPAGFNGRAVTVADFDGDGRADVAVHHSGGGSGGVAGVLLAGGAGGFFAPVDYVLGGLGQDIVAADIDGDHRFDLVASSPDGINILPGAAGGAFGTAQHVAGPQTNKVAVSDFSGDGRADIAATTFGLPSNVLVLTSLGAGEFTSASYSGNEGAFGITAGDWDDNGRADIAVSNASADTNGLTTLDNTCGEAPLGLVVTNTADNGPGSLRQAMQTSNATPGVQTITFNITGPPGTVHTIVLGSPLDAITDGVVIAGNTQPGFDGVPLVVVDGIKAGSGSGFIVLANATIAGLSIVRFLGSGISVQTNGDGTVIQGCYVGVTPDGVAAGNGLGIEVSGAAKVQIGGGPLRNIISANAGAGISASGGIDFPIAILGNYVGLDPAGVTDMGNGTIGVQLAVPADVINNVISGNAGGGIRVLQDDNRLIARGNLIGMNAIATAAMANDGPGISINDAEFNIIGGASPTQRNVISGNTGPGLQLTGDASGTTVQGNFIGVDTLGTTAIPNGGGGVSVLATPGVLLGGSAAGEGNVISGNVGNGVLFDDSRNAVLEGNIIGLDVTGTVDLGNTLSGVLLSNESDDAFIGTATAGGGNIISGNNQNGITITSESSGIGIRNNRIGTDITGTLARGNGTLNAFLDLIGDGVHLNAPSNQVGGPGANERNLISGNGVGVSVSGPEANLNVIQGNLIGTNAAGTGAVRNRWGIFVSGGQNTFIGGSGAGNVISGNSLHGIQLNNDVGTVLQNNLIGTNAAGTAALSNTFNGIFLFTAGAATIGGPASAGNVIAGNGGAGIRVENNGNTIHSNQIGVSSGVAIPNGGAGISVIGSNNQIGSSATIHANTIAFNTGAGVAIDSGISNNVAINVIFSNGGLGIDLDDDGVTANDGPGDVDAGPNDLQNFPVITSAVLGAGTNVLGNITTTAGTTIVIRFWVSASCDASGNGEGQTFLGSTTIVTNVDGVGAFGVNLPGGSAGQVITATATDPNGNTSEFSACRVIVLG
jgi:hypothetical protein